MYVAKLIEKLQDYYISEQKTKHKKNDTIQNHTENDQIGI